MNKKGILCVANWDSNVGYAWWLMESFWVKIAERYSNEYNVYLAYPSISLIPKEIDAAPLVIKQKDFGLSVTFIQVIRQSIFIREHRIKYIYFSDRPLFALRYAIFRLAGVKKIIVHDHTPGLRSHPTGLKRALKKFRSLAPMFNCDAVIGATDFVRNRCINVNCFPKRKCFSAPNGIPINLSDKMPLDVNKKYEIPEDRVIIVSVGRASLYKGLDFALKVIDGLIRKGVCVHYLYLGDGPDFDVCKQLSLEMGIENFVTFAGHVKRVDQYIQSCDIAFHPSRGEVGYSLSILEFMKAGLPVVVPDNPSVSGATDHMYTGMIYRENDVSSAIEVMLNLISEPENRKKMGKNALNKVHKEFSLKMCHRKFLNVMDYIITGS